jgi:NAD-dependent SIR2 family protein deacetylase
MNNIEAVFTAFEMAQIIGALPGHTEAEIAQLVPAMRVVITRTLEERLNFQRSIDQRSPPPPYWHFAEMLLYQRQHVRPTQSSAVVTFNYDLAVDYAIQQRFPIDYGLDPPVAGAIPVLKLHGSLNWFYCSTCERIIPWDLAPLTQKLSALEMNRGQLPIKLSGVIDQWDHKVRLGHDVRTQPVLVPPTWSKAEYHRTLAGVWKRAALELREAENIYIIGFSLPVTDEFFRYLYSLGTVGDTILRRFWVIDPDPSGTVEQRFKSLLGPGAEQRFAFHKETFGRAITRLKNEYEKQSR